MPEVPFFFSLSLKQSITSQFVNLSFWMLGIKVGAEKSEVWSTCNGYLSDVLCSFILAYDILFFFNTGKLHIT